VVVERAGGDAGPGGQVGDVDRLVAGGPEPLKRGKEIPGGFWCAFEDPSGNLTYILDQSTAEAAG
jgi:hypothetical protein